MQWRPWVWALLGSPKLRAFSNGWLASCSFLALDFFEKVFHFSTRAKGSHLDQSLVPAGLLLDLGQTETFEVQHPDDHAVLGLKYLEEHFDQFMRAHGLGRVRFVLCVEHGVQHIRFLF